MCEGVSVEHVCGHYSTQYVKCGKDPRPAEQLSARTPGTKLVWVEEQLTRLWCYGTDYTEEYHSV